MTPFFGLRVDGLPVPQGSKAVTKKGRMYEANKNTKPWRAHVTELAERHVGMLDGWEPLDGPLRVDLTFHMPRPASHYGTGRNSHLLKDTAPFYHSVKPDADKLLRAIFDSLTKARVWVDDSRAAVLHIDKVWTHPGDEGVTIMVEPTD